MVQNAAAQHACHIIDRQVALDQRADAVVENHLDDATVAQIRKSTTAHTEALLVGRQNAAVRELPGNGETVAVPRQQTLGRDILREQNLDHLTGGRILPLDRRDHRKCSRCQKRNYRWQSRIDETVAVAVDQQHRLEIAEGHFDDGAAAGLEIDAPPAQYPELLRRAGNEHVQIGRPGPIRPQNHPITGVLDDRHQSEFAPGQSIEFTKG